MPRPGEETRAERFFRQLAGDDSLETAEAVRALAAHWKSLGGWTARGAGRHHERVPQGRRVGPGGASPIPSWTVTDAQAGGSVPKSVSLTRPAPCHPRGASASQRTVISPWRHRAGPSVTGQSAVRSPTVRIQRCRAPYEA